MPNKNHLIMNEKKNYFTLQSNCTVSAMFLKTIEPEVDA